MTKLGHLLLAALLSTALYGGASAGQQPERYSVKTPDVALPDGVPPGQYARIVKPFGNWTLICDENLKQKQRVCNISQSIVDATGTVAFSWSLAAMADGRPIMILRPPHALGPGKAIEIGFLDSKDTIVARTKDCDGRVCIALVPVDARLKARIAKGALAEISYDLPVGDANSASTKTKVFFHAPLADLAAALEAI